MTLFTGENDVYTLDDFVARGRSGDVFRAVASDGSVVAVKVHDRPDGATLEAARLAEVRHRNIVRLVDAGTTDQRCWLATRWVEGVTLARLLADEGPLDLDRARRLVRQMAAALDALHDVGLVHGDLSPNNVLVDPHEQVTVIDLGSAAAHGGSAIDDTTGVELTVTPRYAAPEVAAGGRPGPASDRYALALIAYEAVTGAFPFPEVATPIAMLAHHASSVPLSAAEHRPSLPAGVDDALLEALAKDPSDRPCRATDFADRFDRDEGRSEAATRAPGRRTRVVALCATVVAAAAVLGLVAASGDDAATLPGGDRLVGPAGEARAAACNLVAAPDFEDESLPDDFYGGDDTNTVVRVREGGVDDTSALRVGGVGQYGLFGEVVPVVEGSTYLFSAAVRADGDVGTAAVYVDFLNAGFEQITAERDDVEVGRSVAGSDWTPIVVRAVAPPGAALAVPTFFKDGSDGSLLVDEVVFGDADECSDPAS